MRVGRRWQNQFETTHKAQLKVIHTRGRHRGGGGDWGLWALARRAFVPPPHLGGDIETPGSSLNRWLITHKLRHARGPSLLLSVGVLWPSLRHHHHHPVVYADSVRSIQRLGQRRGRENREPATGSIAYCDRKCPLIRLFFAFALSHCCSTHTHTGRSVENQNFRFIPHTLGGRWRTLHTVHCTWNARCWVM